MSLLKDINDALKAVDDNVYYGTAATHDKSQPWNYIVFSRESVDRKQNKSGYSYVVNVAIIREDYIQEGLEDSVIEAVEAIPGVRMAEGGHEYFYGVKPNTRHTIEMVVLKFTYSRKL